MMLVYCDCLACYVPHTCDVAMIILQLILSLNTVPCTARTDCVHDHVNSYIHGLYAAAAVF